MALYFTDRLHVYGGSGQYTLEGYDGAQWLPLQTIYGATEGDIAIDGIHHALIPVDTQIPTNMLISFRWNDGQGLISNEVPLVIPGPAVTMSAYAFGTTEIGFSNTNPGHDEWQVTFPYTFDSLTASGHLQSMSVTSVFYQGGAPGGTGSFHDVPATAVYTHPYSSNGAGIYFNYVVYLFDDGAYIVLIRLTQVDATGGIVRSLSMKGYDNVTISGTNISLVAQYEIIGTAPVTATHINFSPGNISGVPNPSGPGRLINTTLPSNTGTLDLTFDFGLTTSEWSDLLVGGNPSHAGCVIDSGVTLA